MLHVRQTLQRAEGKLTLVPAKTARSHRRLPIPPRLAEILRRHRKRQAAERSELGDARTDTGLVFTTSLGTALEPRNVNLRFDQLRRQAGLPWLRLHDLRHAFASMLFAEGVPARTVMELLGHSTIQLTMNTYAHVMPETQETRSAASITCSETEMNEISSGLPIYSPAGPSSSSPLLSIVQDLSTSPSGP